MTNELLSKPWSSQAVCLYAYSFALLVAAALSCSRRLRSDRRALQRHEALGQVFSQGSWFARFMILCFSLRVFWYAARTTGWFGHKCDFHCPYIVVSLANRLASICFFAAFSHVIVCWSGIAGATRSEEIRRAKQARTRAIFLLLNSWLIIAEFVVMGARFFVRLSDQALDNWYTVDSWIVAILTAVVAVSVAYYGCKLYHVSHQHDQSAVLHRAQRRIMAATVLILLLCTARTVFFLWQPVSGHDITGLLGTIVYPWFFYPVPEIVSGFVILFVMWPVRGPAKSIMAVEPAVAGVGGVNRSTSRDALLAANEQEVVYF
mmetsp:Transcript_18392/g.58638  ORF Transcript_18392/g.58638 Transcript_18392/m.58638 type:complete len:319 (+) Transcript_18392:35-991(+)